MSQQRTTDDARERTPESQLRALVVPLGTLALSGILLYRAHRSGSRVVGALGTMIGAHAVRALSPLVSAWMRPTPPHAPPPAEPPLDVVDQASIDSFPASDPPSFTH